jgi:archaellum biogenesis ATPase FlaH
MQEKKEELLRGVLSRAIYKEQEVHALRTLISVGESTIATEGSIITIGGLPKARKSTFMIGLLSAIFSGETIFGFSAEKGKVIVVDTEQTPYDYTRQVDLFKKLSRRKTIPKDFISFLFRQDSIETIKDALILALEKFKPTYLVIDSITDLIYNVNDFEESKKLVQYLKNISALYNVCIITIVHLSKTSNFTLGALGSALDRVSQSTLIVKKDKDTGQSFLEPLYLRSADDFKPIYISYDKEKNIYEETEGVSGDRMSSRKKFSLEDYSKTELSNTCDLVFQDEKEFTYSALAMRCRAIFGVGDTIVRRVVIPYLVSVKLIKNKGGNYVRH